MVPGFTGVIRNAQSGSSPSVRLPGSGTSPAGTCKFTGTSTFCTGLALWCQDNFPCADSRGQVSTQSRTPYPCGACVGVSNPSDW
jgi:hypothetical protein